MGSNGQALGLYFLADGDESENDVVKLAFGTKTIEFPQLLHGGSGIWYWYRLKGEFLDHERSELEEALMDGSCHVLVEGGVEIVIGGGERGFVHF